MPPRTTTTRRVAFRVRLFVVAALLATASGCSRGPETTVRRFLDIAASQRRDRVFAELGPATRFRLTQDAERAAMMAGQRAVDPASLLTLQLPAGAYQLRTLRQSANDAEVEARIGSLTQRFRVVRTDGEWKIEL